MAKAPTPASDQIMSPGAMKPLLALSKREPVQAAIGITADGDGVILLDKKMKPKKCLAKLKAEAGKAKIQLQPSTLRFGKAEVDTEYDPGMVRFFINKEAPGNMRIKLVEVVKRIPYQKVELNVQPSLEDEPEEDEAEGQEAPPQATPTVEQAAYAKSRDIWLATRKKMEVDLDKLRQSILTTFKDDPNVAALDTSYRTKVAGVLAALDNSLADKLNEVATSGASERAQLAAEAKQIMARYAKFLAGEPLLKDLDENPFAPLTIRATVGNTIAALSKAVLH